MKCKFCDKELQPDEEIILWDTGTPLELLERGTQTPLHKAHIDCLCERLNNIADGVFKEGKYKG
jgi:hypothetical protein